MPAIDIPNTDDLEGALTTLAEIEEALGGGRRADDAQFDHNALKEALETANETIEDVEDKLDSAQSRIDELEREAADA